MHFQSVPVWTMGKRNTGGQVQQAPTALGPGRYKDADNGVNKKQYPNYSFGKANRKDINDPGMDLGPGQYKVNISGLSKVGGAPVKAKNRGFGNGNDVPGPGNYRADYNDKPQPSFSIGKEQRKGLVNTNDVPGPNNYKLNYGGVEPNSKNTKFGSGNREDLGNSDTGAIGPGQYNWDKPGKLYGGNKFGRENRKEMAITNTGALGPGAYNHNVDDIGKQKKGYSIQNRHSKFEDINEVGPGPGRYNADKASKFNYGWSFGKQQRKGIANTNEVPGPGNYRSPGNDGGKGNKFGKGTRDGHGDDYNVGPGQYNWYNKNQNATAHMFGKERRPGMGNTGGGPGPGQYNSNLQYAGAGGWSIGKAKRSKLGDGDGANPGPGNYNLGGKQKGGWTFGHEDRAGMKINKTPGFHKIPCSVPDVPKYLLQYDDL